MENEIWKPIIGYENKYEVSNMGNVRSLYYINKMIYKKRPSPIYLKPIRSGAKTGQRYLRVCLYKKNKRIFRRIHHLVLETFVGPRPPNHEGSHLNGISTDNRASNLAWLTHTQNIRQKFDHGTMVMGSKHKHSKLNETIVMDILVRVASGELQKHVAKRYNITAQVINKICRGKNWKHVFAEFQTINKWKAK